MSSSRRIIAVVAGAAALCGATASGASAYAISGGAFTAMSTGPHTFTAAPGSVWRCQSVGATGNATGAASVTLTLTSFNSCDFSGLPGATVTPLGGKTWTLSVTGGPISGVYSGGFTIPSGSSTTFDFATYGCTVLVSGAQADPSGSTATNLGPGAILNINSPNVSFVASSGCPFASASNGLYQGSFYAPGITVS